MKMKDSEARINLDKTCRVCLSEEKNMKSVFSVEQILENEIRVSDILMSCSSITIEKDEGLPDKICYRCSEQANISYLFRKLCESSDSTLRELSKQYELQGDLFTEGNNDITIPKEISLSPQANEIDLENNFDLNKDDSETSVLDESEENNESKKNVLQLHESENIFQQQSIDKNCQKCEYCYDRFTSKSDLSLHIKNECCKSNKTNNIKKRRNLPTSCDICNKAFRFHSNLERHKLVHTKEKLFLCNVCGKSFTQMSALKIHSFTHTGEKPYKCQICTQSFSAPGTLLTHLRTHTGERPHVCKICGKQFPQAGYLSVHVRSHTGEKPTECQICGQKFNQSGRLTIHMRTHSGEKPYQCDVCKRSFAVKSTLKKHIRTHTGERPYKCKICGQSFAQNGTLTTHMKVHKPRKE